jgi:hypothetical protein
MIMITINEVAMSQIHNRLLKIYKGKNRLQKELANIPDSDIRKKARHINQRHYNRCYKLAVLYCRTLTPEILAERKKVTTQEKNNE